MPADGEELQIQLTKAHKVSPFVQQHCERLHMLLPNSVHFKANLKYLKLIAMQGETWSSALVGHELREMETSTDQKQLLLERFQQEASLFLTYTYSSSCHLHSINILCRLHHSDL